MFTFGRLRRLVLRTSAESASTPPEPAWCGKGAPPGSPLGDDLSFFFASIGPAAEAEGPDCKSEDGALSLPAAAAEDEVEEEEEPASDFLLHSIIEDVGGLSWSNGEQKPHETHQSETCNCPNYKTLSEMVGMQMYKTVSLIKQDYKHS